MTASTEERQAARAWLSDHANLSLDELLAAIQEIYGDGALLGMGTAAESIGVTVTGAVADLLPGAASSPIDWPAVWDAWTPGNADAAALLNSGGLADLLDSADVTVRGIADSMLDRLGNLLADGAASGESVDAIAGSMGDLIDDPDRAYMIADTELNRAVSQASLDTYGANDIAKWEWLTSPDACTDCEDLASTGPFDVDGDQPPPPAHPLCRCSVSPVTDSADVPAEDGEGA
jgi:hypothetical protein